MSYERWASGAELTHYCRFLVRPHDHHFNSIGKIKMQKRGKKKKEQDVVNCLPCFFALGRCPVKTTDRFEDFMCDGWKS